MTKLDDVALNIELVLISIIEGVALVSLGEYAVPVLQDFHSLQYLPYVLSGLTILLVFWAQAILHAISFIRWPLRMEHMFLYFLAAFLQVVAYSALEDAAAWFFWWSIFSLLGVLIYIVDLRIIREWAKEFAHNTDKAALATHVEKRHLNELRYLLPLVIALNVGGFCAVYAYPALFEQPLAYAALGMVQFVISIGALIDCMRNFKARSRMLAKSF